MAEYGLKYQLFFSDIELRKVKVEIHQKNYIGLPENIPVTDMIGTGSPVEIEWDAEDDIYHPIIGSRCKLSFFVTDSTTYEDFYTADEREFKVKVLYYQPAGNNWEDEITKYEGGDFIWDAEIGGEIYYQPIWEGFLVVDRYQEAVNTTPYQIKLEAIDGLGTLDGFDMPFDGSDTDTEENLFYFLKEILKLTGHEFDLYIANSIRKVGAADDDTIFHDIIINKYALFTEKMTLRSAKEILEIILKQTNSRIFQSYARWYIVNNSSLIDNRVDINQEIVDAGAGSGEDETDDADTVDPTEPITQPNISLSLTGNESGNVVYVGGLYFLQVSSIGTPIVQYTWHLPDGTTYDSGSSGYFAIPRIELGDDGDDYHVVGTDANGNTDTSNTIVLDVQNRPDSSDEDRGEGDSTDETPEPEDDPVNFELIINISNNVVNASTSIDPREVISYSASEVGNAWSRTIRVFSLVGEFTSASQVTSATITSNSGSYSVSKSLNGDFIEVTISGTLPSGGGNETLSLSGRADVQQFTSTFNLVSNVTNSSRVASPPTLSFTGGEGKPYSGTITYTAAQDYGFTGLGNIQIRSSSDIGQSITTSYTSSTITVTITGAQGITNQDTTITITGAAVYTGGATSVTTSPDGRFWVSSAGGYFDVNITADGAFTVVSNVSWLRPTISQGAPDTTRMRVIFDRSRRRQRTGQIRFTPRGSSTVLATITIDQDADLEAQ
jgi:hypothetical protein